MEMCSVYLKACMMGAVLCLKIISKGKNETPYSTFVEFSINKLGFLRLGVI